jgi:hypothetical protein
MIPAAAAALDMVEARSAVAAEMAAFIAMPDPVAARIPEEAVIAPIAVIEAAIIAIVIAVISAAAPESDIDTLTRGTPCNEHKCHQGKDNFPHGRSFLAPDEGNAMIRNWMRGR